MDHDDERAKAALEAFELDGPVLTPLRMGNINETYVVADRAGVRHILQRLNPIFSPDIHTDIDQVTRFIAARGMVTPRLVPTRAGALWTCDGGGGIWRLQTFIDGVVYSQAPNPAVVRAAGNLLGRFHRTLEPFAQPFLGARLGVHDTARHLAGLRDALTRHGGHTAFDRLAPLADDILRMADALPSTDSLPPRVVHGDPKINNIIFAADGAAVALIDLDTLNRMAITLELGDALRSWCNPQGENNDATTFDMACFEAALAGYRDATQAWLTPDEVALLHHAVPHIALELAARFARDTLEESYFGWDRERFAAAWQHNLVRTQGQLNLARSYARQHSAASRLVESLFGRQ